MAVKKLLKRLIQKEGVKFLKKKAVPIIKEKLKKRKGR